MQPSLLGNQGGKEGRGSKAPRFWSLAHSHAKNASRSLHIACHVVQPLFALIRNLTFSSKTQAHSLSADLVVTVKSDAVHFAKSWEDFITLPCRVETLLVGSGKVNEVGRGRYQPSSLYGPFPLQSFSQNTPTDFHVQCRL